MLQILHLNYLLTRVNFLFFNISITSDFLAKSLLCVTTITHLPCSCALDFNISTISFYVSLSKFPVGSSANITGESATRVLAIATRCC